MGDGPAPVSLDAAVDDPGISSYMQAIIGHMTRVNPRFSSEEIATELIRDCGEFYQLLAFHRAGEHVYEVSPGLGTRLAHTELRGLVADDLQLPFQAVSIVVPPEVELLKGAPRVGDLNLREIYLGEDVQSGERAWCCYLATDKAGEYANPPAFWIRLPNGRSLDECVEATDINMGNSDAIRESRRMWEPVFRWALNVVVYATNGGVREEVWRNSEAAALRDRIEEMPRESKTRRRLQEAPPGAP